MGLKLGSDVIVRQSGAIRRRADHIDTFPSVTALVFYGCGSKHELCSPP